MKKSTPAAAPLRESLDTDLRGQVEQIRSEITAAQERLEEVDEGLVPASELIDRLGSWIDSQSAAFQDDIWQRINGLAGAKPQPAEVGLCRSAVRGANANSPSVVAEADLAPLMCWLLAPVIKQRVQETVQALDFPSGPPSSDRPRLRRELQAKLDRLELEEERVICSAEAAGVQIARRPDVRPPIILNMALLTEDAA